MVDMAAAVSTERERDCVGMALVAADEGAGNEDGAVPCAARDALGVKAPVAEKCCETPFPAVGIGR
jgi:hypothetical protein